MLCYSVVIDTVKSIMNECLVRHAEITQFFLHICECITKMGLCLFANVIILMNVLCYFGLYPYCWDSR